MNEIYEEITKLSEKMNCSWRNAACMRVRALEVGAKELIHCLDQCGGKPVFVLEGWDTTAVDVAHSVEEDLGLFEPQPTPDLMWVQKSIKFINDGRSSSLDPRPSTYHHRGAPITSPVPPFRIFNSKRRTWAGPSTTCPECGSGTYFSHKDNVLGVNFCPACYYREDH